WACACGPARQARPSDRATPPTIVDGLLVLTTAHFLSCPPGLSDPREARSDDGLDCWMDPPLMRLTRTRASRSPPLGGRSSCPGVHVEPVLCCLRAPLRDDAGNRICRTLTLLLQIRQDPCAADGPSGLSRGGRLRGSARLGKRALVDVRAVAAGLLGAVQRHVGRLDEFFGLLDPVVDREGGDARGRGS